MTIRDLLPANTSKMGLQELELPSGMATCGYTMMDQQIVWQILQGAGLMNLNETPFAVVPGDVILIPPAHPYRLTNKSEMALHINQITMPIAKPS